MLSPLILMEWRQTFEGNATWKRGISSQANRAGGFREGNSAVSGANQEGLGTLQGCSGRPKGSGGIEGHSLGGNVAQVSLTCARQLSSAVLHPRPTSTAVTNLRSEAPPVGIRRAHPLGEIARTVQASLSLGEGWGRERL